MITEGGWKERLEVSGSVKRFSWDTRYKAVRALFMMASVEEKERILWERYQEWDVPGYDDKLVSREEWKWVTEKWWCYYPQYPFFLLSLVIESPTFSWTHGHPEQRLLPATLRAWCCYITKFWQMKCEWCVCELWLLCWKEKEMHFLFPTG